MWREIEYEKCPGMELIKGKKKKKKMREGRKNKKNDEESTKN